MKTIDDQLRTIRVRLALAEGCRSRRDYKLALHDIALAEGCAREARSLSKSKIRNPKSKIR